MNRSPCCELCGAARCFAVACGLRLAACKALGSTQAATYASGLLRIYASAHVRRKKSLRPVQAVDARSIRGVHDHAPLALLLQHTTARTREPNSAPQSTLWHLQQAATHRT